MAIEDMVDDLREETEYTAEDREDDRGDARREAAEDHASAIAGTVPEPMYQGRARNGREVYADPLDGLHAWMRDRADSDVWRLWLQIRDELQKRRAEQDSRRATLVARAQ